MTRRRRFHRLMLFLKALNGLIDGDFKFYSFKDIHSYNTRSKKIETFVSLSHNAAGAKTVLFITLLMIGTFF